MSPPAAQRVLHPFQGRPVVSTSIEMLVLVAIAMLLALAMCAPPKIRDCACPSLEDGTFQGPDAPVIEFPREERV